MISHKYQYIFIHIPKTAGNSIANFLINYCDNKIIIKDSNYGPDDGIQIICEKNKKNIKHVKLSYYNKLYGDLILNYFKFMIVRNPYDRIMSYYFWTKGNNDITFNKTEFINFIKTTPLTRFQYIYYDKTIKIIYYENMINELNNIELFKNLNLDFINLPNINLNKNKTSSYDKFYDTELRDLVYNVFEKDFITFNYNK